MADINADDLNSGTVDEMVDKISIFITVTLSFAAAVAIVAVVAIGKEVTGVESSKTQFVTLSINKSFNLAIGSSLSNNNVSINDDIKSNNSGGFKCIRHCWWLLIVLGCNCKIMYMFLFTATVFVFIYDQLNWDHFQILKQYLSFGRQRDSQLLNISSDMS